MRLFSVLRFRAVGPFGIGMANENRQTGNLPSRDSTRGARRLKSRAGLVRQRESFSPGYSAVRGCRAFGPKADYPETTCNDGTR